MRAPAIWSTERAWSGSRPVDCRLTYGTSIGELAEGVEHAHLRRDDDEALDALGGEVRESRRRSSARPTDSMFAVLTQ